MYRSRMSFLDVETQNCLSFLKTSNIPQNPQPVMILNSSLQALLFVKTSTKTIASTSLVMKKKKSSPLSETSSNKKSKLLATTSSNMTQVSCQISSALALSWISLTNLWALEAAAHSPSTKFRKIAGNSYRIKFQTLRF